MKGDYFKGHLRWAYNHAFPNFIIDDEDCNLLMYIPMHDVIMKDEWKGKDISGFMLIFDNEGITLCL